MTAQIFRTYIHLIENEDEMIAFFLDVHNAHPLRQPLRESKRPRLLMEGPLADKIKATAKQVSQKYRDVQYNLLASATQKALNMFAENPQVSGTLNKILKVGKIAMQNRALITILVGMVGTLVGFASNPAAANQASGQMDQVFNGNLDHVIQQLEASGIHIDMTAAGIEGLPPEIGQTAQKAAQALKAIKDYEYHTGATVSSSRVSEFSFDGSIQQENNRFVEEIVLKTADGKVTLAHITTVIENGKYQDSQTGVKFDLWNEIGNLSPDQQKAVEDYINGVVTDRPPETSNGATNPDPAHDLVSAIRAKVPHLALMVAAAAQAKGGTRVSGGPNGITVSG